MKKINENAVNQKLNPASKKNASKKKEIHASNSKLGKKILSKEKKKSDLIKFDLSEFKNQLSKNQYQDKIRGERDKSEYLYKYPESWNKFNINGIEGKNLRNKLRSKMNQFSEKIGFYSYNGDQNNLQIELKNFLSFYKEFYSLNDFSILHHSNLRNPIEKGKIEILLNIAKKFASKLNPAKKKSNPAKLNPAKKKSSLKKKEKINEIAVKESNEGNEIAS